MRFRQNFAVDFEEFNGLEEYVQELKRDGIRVVIILVRFSLPSSCIIKFKIQTSLIQ